jgi:YD repeat-containing protein
MKTVLVALLLATLAFAAKVDYTQDAAGRLVRVDYDSGASIKYVHDKAGNLLSRTVTAAAPESSAKKPPPKKKAAR